MTLESLRLRLAEEEKQAQLHVVGRAFKKAKNSRTRKGFAYARTVHPTKTPEALSEKWSNRDCKDLSKKVLDRLWFEAEDIEAKFRFLERRLASLTGNKEVDGVTEPRPTLLNQGNFERSVTRHLRNETHPHYVKMRDDILEGVRGVLKRSPTVPWTEGSALKRFFQHVEWFTVEGSIIVEPCIQHPEYYRICEKKPAHGTRYDYVVAFWDLLFMQTFVQDEHDVAHGYDSELFRRYPVRFHDNDPDVWDMEPTHLYFRKELLTEWTKGIMGIPVVPPVV